MNSILGTPSFNSLKLFACVFIQTPSPFLSLTLRSALLLYNKMLNRCAIEFFVKHIQCSFLLFYIHFEARQFGTLEGDPKVLKGHPLCFYCIESVFSGYFLKKYSYSFEFHWNSYCLFGKFLLSLYLQTKRLTIHSKQYGKGNT